MVLLTDALNNIVTPRLEFHMETLPSTVDIVTAGNYVKLTPLVAHEAKEFSVVSSTATYDCDDTKVFTMNGVADIQVDKACIIYFALYLNGSIVPHEVTPHTFTSAAKTDNISITALAELAKDDEIEIYATSSVSNTEISIQKLDVVFSTNLGGC